MVHIAKSGVVEFEGKKAKWKKEKKPMGCLNNPMDFFACPFF
jgi:hypothetical protein